MTGKGLTERDGKEATVPTVECSPAPLEPRNLRSRGKLPARAASPKKTASTSQRPPGLQNLGNTCYLNSLLQALLAVPAFWDPASHRVHSMVPKVAKQLFKTLSSMKDSERAAPNTKPLLQELQRVKIASGATEFRYIHQQDVAEVLNIVIDALKEACVNWKESVTDPHDYVSCKNCGEFTVSDAEVLPYLVITPSFGKLQDILNRVTQRESADYGCSNCGNEQLVKQHLFHRAPKVLVIQLNRAVYANQVLSKDPSVVEISMTLNFPTKRGNKLYCTPYTLKAVVCHEGVSPVEGHYYTYAKHHEKWYRCNDKVMEINKNVIMPTLNSKHAYIYLFEKHS